MAQYDFSGLMDNAKPETQSKYKYDFSGLMDKSKTLDRPKIIKKQQNLDSFIKERIKSRGSVWSEFKPGTKPFERISTGLKTVGLPFELLQSGIANPIIALQQGKFNPINLVKEAGLGIAGIKQGEFRDIPRGAGISETPSNVIGFMADIAMPLGLSKIAGKLGAVSKYADKRTAKAITSFVNAVEGKGGALNKVGGKVQKFYNEIGETAINKNKFLDELANASNIAKKQMAGVPNINIKDAEASLLNLAEQGNVNAVRQARQLLDDLITSWANSASGKKISSGQKALMKISRNLNDIADSAIAKAKGIKYVNKFKKARLNYSELKKGYASIQRKMVNPITGKPTKTGKLLKEILDSRESDLRTTLSALNKFGAKSNKFAQELRNIEKIIRSREFAGRLLKGVAYTTAIGAALKSTGGARGIFKTGQQGE